MVIEEDFVVAVGAGAVAGVADEGDDLAAFDGLALARLVPLVVPVEGLVVVGPRLANQDLCPCAGTTEGP